MGAYGNITSLIQHQIHSYRIGRVSVEVLLNDKIRIIDCEFQGWIFIIHFYNTDEHNSGHIFLLMNLLDGKQHLHL